MSSEYSPRDFDDLLVNVYAYKGSGILAKFPLLSRYKVFKTEIPVELDIDMVLRYIVFCFDKNSPFQSVSNQIDRRVKAAMEAGFEPKGRRFPDEVDKMIRCLIPNINHMIIQYCILQGEDDYTSYVAYQESLRRQLEELTDGGDDANTTKIIANTKALRAEVNALRTSILGTDTDAFLKRSLFEFTEAEKLELSPEFYAEKLRGWDNISKYYKVEEQAK